MASRQLRLGGRVPQLGLQLLDRLFQAARLAAQVARAPVHVAQAVEDGAPNTELGVGGEAHILAGVVLVHGIDQSHDAGMQQVVERNVLRQPLMNAAGDVFHLRQLLQQQLIGAALPVRLICS